MRVVMQMKMNETDVDPVERAVKDLGGGLQTLFTAAKIQPKDDDATIYHGTVRNQRKKVGEFVARVEWRSYILFIEELSIERA
jgi:hypothetical protein